MSLVDPSFTIDVQGLVRAQTNPRSDISDLIAREGMKDLDGKVGFPERRSKIALETSGKFKFFAPGRQDFQNERAKQAQLEKDGFNESAYHGWL
jgi:hypothetical protein